MTNFIGSSTSSAVQDQARVQDLKSRLDWGEPALTIIDVRDHRVFNQEHITGAISMPADVLVETIGVTLEKDRDIYIYGETDDETVEAASSLRNAGYLAVAELRGGMSAWKAVGYPTEIIAAA
ncbi:MAG: rhodanese-like domain-containing protein [Cyanobacteria bacterium J06627_8]